MTTTILNIWIIRNAAKLRARLSLSPGFDEDAFQDAYLTLIQECRQQDTCSDIERTFLAAYRKHTGKHISETYTISHPDDIFFTLLPSADEEPEEEPADDNKPGLVASIRRHIRTTFTKQEATAFEMRMSGYTYRDIADVTGMGTTALINASGRIIASTRLQFAGLTIQSS